MKKTYFITSTNTDRGKTIVTSALFAWFLKQNISVTPMKPVQTGVSLNDPTPDLSQHYRLNNLSIAPHLLPHLQPYGFNTACSPHLAAQRDKLPPPSLDRVKMSLEKLHENFDVILMEGAGGLMVPIDVEKKICIIDWIEELKVEVLLVAQRGLGSINDTYLSIEAMQRRNIPIAGFITNNHDNSHSEDFLIKDNVETIMKLTGVPHLGEMPFLTHLSQMVLCEQIENMVTLKNHLKKAINNNG